MVHRGQKITSDGKKFKVLRVLKDTDELDAQTKLMDKYHEKLNCPVYGMGHDGKLIVAVEA